MADDPRDELLAVAREIIDKRGYLGLSMRTAAAAAGVTEQVARRYYRNRDSLFAAALRLPVDPASAIPTLVAPGLEGMGERLVRFTLDVLKDPEARDDLLSLARTGAHAGHAALGMRDFLERGVIDRVATAIGVPDARMRSALISSYLLGIAMSRYVVRLEPLASASEEEVVRMVAPVIQDLLDPRRPIPGSSRARAAGHEQRTGTAATAAGQRVPPPPEPAPAAATPPPKPFDPDPGRSAAVSSAELLGMGAANLSATTMQVAANALRAAAVAASRAGSQPSPSRPRSASRPSERGATPAAPPVPPATPAAEPAPAAKRAAARTPTTPSRSTATKRTTAASSPEKSATAKRASARSTTSKSAATKRATAKPPTRSAPAPTTAPTTPAPKGTPAPKAPAKKATAKKATAKKATAGKPRKSPQNHSAAPPASAPPSAPAKAAAAPSQVEPTPAEERPTEA